MRKITFRKLRKSKRQVPLLHLPRRARVAELWTNWQSNSGTFTHVHWPFVCRNKTSPRRTDQSMIEAAKCMFHKLLGEVRDDLDRVSSQSQGGPYAEIKQSKQRCSRTAILEENPCPHRGTERKICTSNVNRNGIAAIFGRDTRASCRG